MIDPNGSLVRRIATAAAGIVALAACSAAPPSDEGSELRSDAIIGGTVDPNDPAVVLMKAENGNVGWWCTGSVIAKRLVLTAAHCVEDAGASTKIRVMFGTYEKSSKPSDYIAVKSWAHDPKYMATNNIAAGHDAAVLVLTSDAPVAPLPINRTAMTNAMIGSPVHVVGFGNDNGASGTGSGTKREIHTTLTGLEQGVANIGHTGQTTCQGDSGGPSFMKIGGTDVIVGITSYGSFGCVDYGSVTRVDLAASWIDPYIAANGGAPDDPGGDDPCTPACNGRACGADGCGGVCGTCSQGASCSDAGQCVVPPPTQGCDEAEPNDGKGSANALCEGGKMTGHITKSYDHDWYTWKVSPGSTYTIDLATDHEFVMTLYKVGTGGQLQEIVSSFDQISKYTPSGGTYYLSVWGGNGDFSPIDPYSVSVAITK